MPLFVLLWILVFVFAPVWTLVQAHFLKVLYERYPQEVEEYLGPPRTPLDVSTAYMTRVYRFVFGRKYRSFADKRISMEGDVLLVAMIVEFSSAVALFVIPPDVFIRWPF